jgi:hypothetical protein
MHQGFQVTIPPFGVEQEVPDKTNAIPLLQPKRKRRFHWFSLDGPGRIFAIEIIPSKSGILRRMIPVQLPPFGVFTLVLARKR